MMPKKTTKSTSKKEIASSAARTRKRAVRGVAGSSDGRADSYRHPEAEVATRPDVGTQAGFRKKKAPKVYKYDSSLSPALDWDGQNAARERGEELIRIIQEADSLDAVRAAADELAALSRPFLNWSGKAERLSFDVPTLPLFVHERLSTQAILETLKRHTRDEQESLDLFGDPKRSITDQIMRAYEHRDEWVNRLILGDSLVVMNSLLEYEGMGGQVQMIYIDPPYGVKFGSNFQPFIRKRDVKHNDDTDMTREPEMVQAYRDTWELGLHSYLTYLRDRLLVARELLTPSGSVFVQISDENLHHVRELMDEVFGSDNFVAAIVFQKTGGQNPTTISAVHDTLLWYARDHTHLKVNPLYSRFPTPPASDPNYVHLEFPDGTQRPMTPEERRREVALPPEAKIFRYGPITSAGSASSDQALEYDGETFRPPGNAHWKASLHGMRRLIESDRVLRSGRRLAFKLYWHDFAAERLTNIWTDTQSGGFNDPQVYVVQTTTKVVKRCMLMTSDPGDLVVDPTCGSGTTAYVAEQWGRRWITIDTSRVPLALTRQRVLTATFPWYELKEPTRGPVGGFVYKRKLNNRGEDLGGIVPHVTLKSIANDEPPTEEILVDSPEKNNSITRVSGPFVVEATIPTPVDYEGDGIEDSGAHPLESYATFVERMIEVLRRNPKLQISGGGNVELRNIRPPAKSMSISAEALVDSKPVAIVFGPENGAVSEKLVFNAGKEANARNYTHLIVIGFSIQPTAREIIENAASVFEVPATYVAATPDILMGDLLKTMRSSQIFSVCGLPEISIEKKAPADHADPDRYIVKLLGLDTFNPATMDAESIEGNDVPAWFLDTDYNELSFHVSQAFFPRTGAWENLRRALRATHDDSVWDHLNGTESTPFVATPETKIAVKVIDTRGNELMVVKTIGEAIKQNG